MAKVGAYYTIGFLLIMLVFLALIILVNKEFKLSIERFSEDAGFEKIHNIDDSIQKSLRDIFFSSSGISVSATQTSASFSETLPNSEDNNFKSNITKFKDFIETNYSVIFDTDEITTNLPLILKPHGITYSHSDYGDNILSISYNDNNFGGFQVTLNIN